MLPRSVPTGSVHGNAPSAVNSRLAAARCRRRHADAGDSAGGLFALWLNAPVTDVAALWQDSYLWHVVRFSFWQAFLSALLSVAPAIFLARALYRRRFPGRQMLLRLCAMTLILPVLVAVFGILSVYGRQGWLAQIFGSHWTFSPYGLQGILLAHVFFNLPMATRLLLQALEQIPGEQRQLAAQLGMRGWAFFRFVEWPWLRRQIPPVAALIFMLCFASFATVLSLGGGPQATTIELAIYQALSYDFELCRAALLALIQMICCLGLVLLSQRLSKTIAVGTNHITGWRDPQDSLFRRLADSTLIVLALLLLLPPLIAVIVGDSTAVCWTCWCSRCCGRRPGPRCVSRYAPGCCV